ncbi:hypothetical protein V3C99_016000 [Haemonchus contortus]
MVGILLLLVSTLVCSFAQILELKPGRVQGFEYTTKGGDIAEVFLGIPYAAAPVGELRFEFGATCHPHERKSAVLPDPSEDCLTLNVIRPRKEAPAEGYPILLWVHGGGYEIGSASLYGYKGFADIYIPHDIIVVTIQYRLGVYGFFSSGDSRMPGNLGLFDMAEAVKFVYENAENMGADPSRITAWGLSAGGAAVGQLLLSPVSRDYIARSIEMSGSPWVSWAMGPNVPKNSLELAEVLECTEDLKNCMKRKTVEEIYAATEKVVTIKARAHTILSNLGISPDDFLLWNRDKLVATIKNFIRHEFFESNTDEVIDKVIAYYVNRDEVESYDFYLDRYTEFISDVMFNVPAVDGILSRREKGWNLFAYSFNHYNKAIWPDDLPKRLKGSTHVNEYPYMFDIFAMGEFEIDETEQIVADVVQQSFINFVKTGMARRRDINGSSSFGHITQTSNGTGFL